MSLVACSVNSTRLHRSSERGTPARRNNRSPGRTRPSPRRMLALRKRKMRVDDCAGGGASRRTADACLLYTSDAADDM
eukprot:4361746-Prymnesium_polylepis.2